MTEIPFANEFLDEEEFKHVVSELSGHYKYAFNGVCEVLQRQLIILHAFRKHKLEFRVLSLLDFFVQHGGDMGLPTSLHYPNPNRSNGYYVRLDRIDAVQKLLWATGLLKASDEGLWDFQLANDLALNADDFSSPYLQALAWSAEYLEGLFRPNPEEFLKHMYGRLAELKKPDLVAPSSVASERFDYLKVQYSLDYPRMQGLAEAIKFQRELFDSDLIVRNDWNAKLRPTKEQFDLSETATAKELRNIPAQYHDLCDLVQSLGDKIDTIDADDE